MKVFIFKELTVYGEFSFEDKRGIPRAVIECILKSEGKL